LGAPAEMVLRLLILKHIRNWSYVVLEREVRAKPQALPRYLHKLGKARIIADMITPLLSARSCKNRGARAYRSLCASLQIKGNESLLAEAGLCR
jgi:hypothetical protein